MLKLMFRSTFSAEKGRKSYLLQLFCSLISIIQCYELVLILNELGQSQTEIILFHNNLRITVAGSFLVRDIYSVHDYWIFTAKFQAYLATCRYKLATNFFI